MDGVLADVYTRYFELHREVTGQQMTVNDIAGLLEAEAFPLQLEWAATPGFFRSIPLMPGSLNGLKRLNETYDVIIVSLATEFPNSLIDKQLWLHDHFSFIKWQQIVFCGNKNIIKADVMIDDHPKNLDHFNGDTILFNQPHNMLLTTPRHRRVSSWEEIEKLLIP